MQYCSVMVARGGDLTNTVLRDNVSVPEIGVLIGIHGLDGVARIDGTTDDRPVNHLEEYDRIANIYGAEAATKMLGQRGFNTQLPTRLSSVFHDVADEPGDRDEPAKPTRRKPTRRKGLQLTPKQQVESEECDLPED